MKPSNEPSRATSLSDITSTRSAQTCDSRREKSSTDGNSQKVEAAGIEPASRDISTQASTCVVVWFNFARLITHTTRLADG